MKNLVILLMITGCLSVLSCQKKESQSDYFTLLTTPVWKSDSLLVNGADASGTGGMLELFKGDAKFNADGTGNFGSYTGTWRFANNETQIVITSPSLPLTLTTLIAELTNTSLKVTTSYPNLANPSQPIKIRMTFKAK
jgi:hypothetical protein